MKFVRVFAGLLLAGGNLSSTIRLFVLEYARAQREAAAQAQRASHGLSNSS